MLPPTSVPLRFGRPYRLLWLAAFLVLGAFTLVTPQPAEAAPVGVTQCNGTDNVGGQSVACTVTIVNSFDVATGTASSTVTLQECHGFANTTPTCVTSSVPAASETTSVAQCNGSGSGGGGTVTCAVSIVNNITGAVTATAATINQCVGSGEDGGTQPTTQCSPLGNTSGATVTQCNGSGNGGGGTIRVQCTVPAATRTAALPVSVNQCNGSGNGGGATVTCTVTVVNNIRAAATATPTPTPTLSPVPTTVAAPPATGVRTPAVRTPGTGVPVTDLPRTGLNEWALGGTGLALLVLGTVLVEAGRTRRRPTHLRP